MTVQNFVMGYWRKNLGDDLFLKILADRYPDVDFYIQIDEVFYSVFENIKNVRPIFNDKSITGRVKSKICRELLKINTVIPRSLQHIILSAQNVIEIGGSIFIMKTDKMDNSYALRSLIAKKIKHHYIIGSNFGPYETEMQRKKYEKIFNAAEWISFRDEYSLNLFKNINGNLNWFPDVVFCLNVEKYKKNKEYILISMMDFNNPCYGDNYEKWLIKQIKHFVRVEKEKVVLMAFCEFQGDAKCAARLYGNLDDEEKKYVEIFIHTEINKSLEVFSGAKKVIASRYHAMILAWLFRIPVYVISYSEKTLHVIESIAPQQHYILIEDLNEDVQAEYSTYTTSYFDPVINSAFNHFLSLDRAFSKKGQ